MIKTLIEKIIDFDSDIPAHDDIGIDSETPLDKISDFDMHIRLEFEEYKKACEELLKFSSSDGTMITSDFCIDEVSLKEYQMTTSKKKPKIKVSMPPKIFKSGHPILSDLSKTIHVFGNDKFQLELPENATFSLYFNDIEMRKNLEPLVKFLEKNIDYFTSKVQECFLMSGALPEYVDAKMFTRIARLPISKTLSFSNFIFPEKLNLKSWFANEKLSSINIARSEFSGIEGIDGTDKKFDINDIDFDEYAKTHGPTAGALFANNIVKFRRMGKVTGGIDHTYHIDVYQETHGKYIGKNDTSATFSHYLKFGSFYKSSTLVPAIKYLMLDAVIAKREDCGFDWDSKQTI